MTPNISKFDVIIVGGGIVGYSTAMQLLQQDPALKVIVLEKESEAGLHQTNRNSGVIHAGVYYQAGTLKADFCRAGCDQAKAFCEQHQIPYQEIGKLIVATSESELAQLDTLEKNCKNNRLTVLRLTAAEVENMQAGLSSVGGLFVKESGIVDWRQVCLKYAEIFHQLGGQTAYNQKVKKISEHQDGIDIETAKGSVYHARYLITCAGLYADDMVRLSGLEPEFRIIPFRGEFYCLPSSYNHTFKHLVYPVPNPELPFLGVHITPQINGDVLVGPNAVVALGKEAYSWKTIHLKETASIFSYLPFWRMLFKYLRATFEELYSSLSKSRYLYLIKQYYSGLSKKDLLAYPAGIRAQAIDKQGNLVKDFLFVETDRILHVCNAPSPAATSSLPIGAYLVAKISKKMSSAHV